MGEKETFNDRNEKETFYLLQRIKRTNLGATKHTELLSLIC